jgi:hypothetical protein
MKYGLSCPKAEETNKDDKPSNRQKKIRENPINPPKFLEDFVVQESLIDADQADA